MASKMHEFNNPPHTIYDEQTNTKDTSHSRKLQEFVVSPWVIVLIIWGVYQIQEICRQDLENAALQEHERGQIRQVAAPAGRRRRRRQNAALAAH